MGEERRGKEERGRGGEIGDIGHETDNGSYQEQTKLMEHHMNIM